MASYIKELPNVDKTNKNSMSEFATKKVYQCQICLKTFENKKNLRKHDLVHLNVSQHKCEQCGDNLKSKNSLKVHTRLKHTHMFEKYVCETCKKKFVTKSSLTRHVKRVHEKLCPHSCEICDEKFPNRETLLDHTRRKHTFEKPFVCEVCEKRFVISGELAKHKVIHGGVGAFTCEICGSKFRRRSHANQHFKTLHDPEKPLTCKVCDKLLPTKYDLNVHTLTHDSKKPFSCKICGLKFGRRSHEIKHFNTMHIPEKPLPCKMCDKLLATKYDFTVHIRIHDSEKPFSCELCGRGFNRSLRLEKHINSIHKIIK